jgi:hypothetical protein
VAERLFTLAERFKTDPEILKMESFLRLRRIFSGRRDIAEPVGDYLREARRAERA